MREILVAKETQSLEDVSEYPFVSVDIEGINDMLESVNCFVDRQLDIPNSIPPDFTIFCPAVIPNTRNDATAF